MALPDPLSREIFTFGNDPTLPDQVTAAADLRRGLAEIASKSGYDRSLEGFKASNASALARQNNLASLIQSYIPQGIDLPGLSGGRMDERYEAGTVAKLLENISAADALGAGPVIPPGARVSAIARSDPFTLPTTPSAERVARAGQNVTTIDTGTSGEETITGVGLEGEPSDAPLTGPRKRVIKRATKEGTKVKAPSTIGPVTDAGLRNRLIADVVRQGKKIETIAGIDDVGPSQWRISFNDGSDPIYATKPTTQ